MTESLCPYGKGSQGACIKDNSQIARKCINNNCGKIESLLINVRLYLLIIARVVKTYWLFLNTYSIQG